MPAGANYRIVISKGNYYANWQSGVAVTVGGTTDIGTKALTSAEIAAGSEYGPPLAGTLSISGFPMPGFVLTVNTLGLTNSFGHVNYVWKRDGVTVIGENSPEYTVAEEDLGHTITVTVSYSHNAGSITISSENVVNKLTLDKLAFCLNSISPNNAANAFRVILDPSEVIDTGTSGNWSDINDIIQSAGKYVILDLSECTAEDNTITSNANIIGSNQYITGISLPGDITSIGGGAFEGCSGLTSISLPSSVTSIGANAFSDSSITSVTFDTGSDVTDFGDYAFPEGAWGVGGNILRTAYLAANPHAGTYTRSPGGSDWAKQ